MVVEVSKNAGFCKGVELCTQKLESLLNEHHQLYCIGEIVHNKEVVKSFQEKGLIVVESIDEVPNNAKMVIRAHGAPKELYETADGRGIQVFDLTCPKVLGVRHIVKPYLNDDTFVILIAQKDHPETLSTISFCGNHSMIVEDENDLETASLYAKPFKNVVIIGQTTFSEQKYKIYSEKLEKKLDVDNIIIKNTICDATSIRQSEVEKMSKKKDCMIVIGGKNSSNTKKLYEIAKNNCPNTYWIEKVAELPIEEIKAFSNIGLTAGASTPKWMIDEVVETLKKV